MPPSDRFRNMSTGRSMRNAANNFFNAFSSTASSFTYDMLGSSIGQGTSNMILDESNINELLHGDKRSAHNALERQRRENLNSKFQQLAHALPSLQSVRRPSKTVIVAQSLEYVSRSIERDTKFQDEIEQLRKENERLRNQVQHSRLCHTTASTAAASTTKKSSKETPSPRPGSHKSHQTNGSPPASPPSSLKDSCASSSLKHVPSFSTITSEPSLSSNTTAPPRSRSNSHSSKKKRLPSEPMNRRESTTSNGDTDMMKATPVPVMVMHERGSFSAAPPLDQTSEPLPMSSTQVPYPTSTAENVAQHTTFPVSGSDSYDMMQAYEIQPANTASATTPSAAAAAAAAAAAVAGYHPAMVPGMMQQQQNPSYQGPPTPLSAQRQAFYYNPSRMFMMNMVPEQPEQLPFSPSDMFNMAFDPTTMMVASQQPPQGQQQQQQRHHSISSASAESSYAVPPPAYSWTHPQI
ncbi:hypothetical protein BCR43DRAFT_297955 [Syncephalastrum racemosum]|uniref:BHLH domain-containing protein n=1 Tax=Syncephalastrum racemosum TaxID=13706 RepID=A0A1X2H9I2_SYNRA|nr:hypothetical protein BCR43DRAFT_297955 [Syncephalastrum racemosum]